MSPSNAATSTFPKWKLPGMVAAIIIPALAYLLLHARPDTPRAERPPVRPAILRLTRAEYTDRVQAIWTAQIIAVLLAWPHEHQTASVRWLNDYPRDYTVAPVDDDWYYEMCAIRAFEKYGVEMTATQLGDQWLENRCGSWGSREQALFALRRGIQAPDTGHPRYNKLWFTIGPQFSSEVYGVLAPGMPNLAGRLARKFGHINGYAEAVDGAVFMAGMVSLGFVEKDTREVVKKAASLIHPSSPYRKCLDQVIASAEGGKSFEEVVAEVEDRWHIEYPATNNAVANGGIVASCLWFGKGDFLATVNLRPGPPTLPTPTATQPMQRRSSRHRAACRSCPGTWSCPWATGSSATSWGRSSSLRRWTRRSPTWRRGPPLSAKRCCEPTGRQ